MKENSSSLITLQMLTRLEKKSPRNSEPLKKYGLQVILSSRRTALYINKTIKNIQIWIVHFVSKTGMVL